MKCVLFKLYLKNNVLEEMTLQFMPHIQSRCELCNITALTLSTFSDVLTVWTDPDDFFYQKTWCSHVLKPYQNYFLVWDCTVVFYIGMSLKRHWVVMTDSIFFTKVSYANTQCFHVHCSTLIEIAYFYSNHQL